MSGPPRVYKAAGSARFNCGHVDWHFVWPAGGLHIEHEGNYKPQCPEGCGSLHEPRHFVEGDDPHTADTEELEPPAELADEC